MAELVVYEKNPAKVLSALREGQVHYVDLSDPGEAHAFAAMLLKSGLLAEISAGLSAWHLEKWQLAAAQQVTAAARIGAWIADLKRQGIDSICPLKSNMVTLDARRRVGRRSAHELQPSGRHLRVLPSAADRRRALPPTQKLLAAVRLHQHRLRTLRRPDRFYLSRLQPAATAPSPPAPSRAGPSHDERNPLARPERRAL